jgi:hypothetical protein
MAKERDHQPDDPVLLGAGRAVGNLIALLNEPPDYVRQGTSAPNLARQIFK